MLRPADADPNALPALTVADPDAGSRFTALRRFALEACTSACSSPTATWTRFYTSRADAFPGVSPRPVAPNLTLRGFDVPDTRAAAIRLVTLENQCTGYARLRRRAGRRPAQRHRLRDGIGPRARSCTPRSCRSTDRDRAGVAERPTGHDDQGWVPPGAHPLVANDLRLAWPEAIRKCGDMVGRIPVMNVMPVVDLGRQPAKATVGEPFPVSATVFREGHDKLGAEVVLTGPDGQRRAPVRMVKHAEVPDRYDAWVTPDAPGSWTFEVQAWSDPLATWQHDAGIKIPAGVDVELMFTEARLLLERVAADLDPADRHGHELLAGAIEAAGRDRRPPGPGPPRRAAGPRARRPPAGPPAARAGHRRGPLPGVRRPRARAVQQLVRVLPALRGRHPRPRDRQGHQRHLPHRRQAPRRRRRDGLRRHLPAADPPDRRGQPQGPEQHAHPRPRRHRLAVGDRLQGRRARRDPPRPGRRSRTSTPSSPAPASSASRSRSTWPCRPRPTTRGSPRTPSGSPPAPTAPSPTPRTRRRSTRTSTRSTSTTTPTGICREVLRIGPAVDVARRADLPRRQPAHQAGGVLGVAAQGDPPHRPRRALPRRGVHPAGDDARRSARSASTSPTPTSPGATRSGRSRTTCASCRTETDHLMRPNFFVNTPDILHAYLQYGGPAAFKIRAAIAATGSPELGRVRRLRALRARGGQAGQRGVPRLGEVPDPDPRLGRRRAPRAAPWRRTSPGSTRSAAQHPALQLLRNVRDPRQRRRERPGLLQGRPRQRATP